MPELLHAQELLYVVLLKWSAVPQLEGMAAELLKAPHPQRRVYLAITESLVILQRSL